ncbi:MAG: cupin domain-containing protein [Verrucomicrobiales bacterium]|nr:cupin domain-containing protein [Verrucomicrobiales bacterium]
MISWSRGASNAGWLAFLIGVVALGARPDRGETTARFERIERTNLWNIAEWQDTIDWRPFRPGVEIHRLYGDGQIGPTAALLRYKQAATVPMHTHEGFEHILVLSGSQKDQNGILRAGTLSIHAPGTRHAVQSEAGCIVLAIYEKPVKFDPPGR